MITPELVKLINEKKNSNKNEQKIQLSIGVNFVILQTQIKIVPLT